MSDNSDRSKGFSHPTPEEMGVSPEAAAHANRAAWYVDAIKAITIITLMITRLAIRKIAKVWAAIRSRTLRPPPFALTFPGPRTQWGDLELWRTIGGAIMVAATIGALAWAAFSKGTDPPEAPTALEVIVAQDGDNYYKLAQELNIPWQDLVAANLDQIDENTAWCLSRKMPVTYYQGKTTSGGDRRTEFCELTMFMGKMRAIGTLRDGQEVTVPYRDGSVDGEERSMALTDQ